MTVVTYDDKERDHLTGKAFSTYPATQGNLPPEFQLEAVIEGEITRLQARGAVPKTCLHDDRHKLHIGCVLESLPPKYEIECDTCGYKVTMHDVSGRFKRVD